MSGVLENLLQQVKEMRHELVALRREVERLRTDPPQARLPPPQPPEATAWEPPQPASLYVTIDFFMKKMLGRSREAFYRTQRENQPNFPRRVYPTGAGGKPRLLFADCKRYVEQVNAASRPKRPVGRPRNHPAS